MPYRVRVGKQYSRRARVKGVTRKARRAVKGKRLNELPEYFVAPVKVKARVRNPVTNQAFYMQKTFYVDSKQALKSAVLNWLRRNQFRPDDVRSIRVYL